MITFVILTWNSDSFIKKCLDSLIKLCLKEQIKFEIINIDNGSIDHTLDIILNYQKLYPEQINLISFQKNMGTTVSRNAGLKNAKGDYICILDSDTVILNGSLIELCNYLDQNRSVGILAPKLLLPSGEIQNSVKKFPTFIHKFKKVFGIIFFRQVTAVDFYKDFPFEEIRPAATAISAFWFFRKTLLDEVGYLDENIFYSPEDLDFSVRSWEAGKSIIYFPRFVVFHNTQQITHKHPLSKTSLSHLKGLIYYFRKHGGWFSTKHLYQLMNRS